MARKIGISFMIAISFLILHLQTTAFGKADIENINYQNGTKAECFTVSKEKSYAINVSVANVWSKTNQSRKEDSLSVQVMPDMAKWTKGLSVAQKNGLIGRLDTQALYGDEIAVLESKGEWLRIAVKDQQKPDNPKGYEGWVRKAHVTEVKTNYTGCPIAIVNAKMTTLYNESKLSDKYAFLPVSYTTILPVAGEKGDWLRVGTPADGLKYIRKQDVKVYSDFNAVPKPAAEEIVNAAKQYIGLPYLWAGISAYGFDCSGLTYSIYKNHGILLPRDSGDQAKVGMAVKRSQLKQGDLLFFAHQKGKGKVYHVGMYIGDGKMVHAPNSSKKVEIVSIHTGTFKTNFAGARRYLK